MMFPLSDDPLPDPDRVRVKICGLTNPADAEMAITLGADALGFNFYPPSPRSLDLEKDADWIRGLPASAQKVAVTVNPRREEIDRLLEAGVADVIQLHGDEDEDFCRALWEARIPFAKAIRVRGETALWRSERFHTSSLLLDAYQPNAFGGTGHQVDWALAARFSAEQKIARRRVILSGGLKPENVAEAILQVRPAGVDAASGVEGPDGNPRRKDAERVRAFIEAVRNASEKPE
jgi:phosphoribosylanthranilate isomerase